MRLWIIGAALAIAEAIRPGIEYPRIVTIFLVFLVVSGFFIDACEIAAKRIEAELLKHKEE